MTRRRSAGRLVALAGLALAVTSHCRSVSPSPLSGWSLVFDRPTSSKYEDFSFPTTSEGWLVSGRGDILHSIDGGFTWAVQATGKGTLRSVDFLDTLRGFTGTLSGVLYSTSDGGQTWTDITSQLPYPAKGFCGMTHAGRNVHMVGRYTGGATDYFYSPDEGTTWQHTDLSAFAQGLVEVQFLNESIGFIGGMSNSGAAGQGSATISKTTDGGRSWRTVFTNDAGVRGLAWKIFPVSMSVLYAGLQSDDGVYRVAKSVDAGETWTVQIAATGRALGMNVQGIGFIDENIGWIGGFFDGMWTTSDGGQTWSEVPFAGSRINRFERVGTALITAGSKGVLRYER